MNSNKDDDGGGGGRGDDEGMDFFIGLYSVFFNSCLDYNTIR